MKLYKSKRLLIPVIILITILLLFTFLYKSNKTTTLQIFIGVPKDRINRVLYVTDLYAVKTEGSGDSWATAYGYDELQTAIDDAEAAYTGSKQRYVVIKKGVYKPTHKQKKSTHSKREKHFSLRNGVTVIGGYNGDETDGIPAGNEVTILSGDIGILNNNADNSYHVFYHNEEANLNSTAVLQNVIITGGNANGAYPHYDGGGMFNHKSSPIIIGCSFIKNNASSGGGLENYKSKSKISNCNFLENTSGQGGGVSNQYSNTTIINCNFANNVAKYGGGGILNMEGNPDISGCNFTGNTANEGGGIHNHRSSASITNCNFIKNTAINDGGGMFNNANSEIIENKRVIVRNCSFLNNTAANYGGGMYSLDCSPNIISCNFIENTAKNGGGMSNGGSNPIFINCDFIQNQAQNDGGGMNNYLSGACFIINCNFNKNTAIIGKGGAIYNNRSSYIDCFTPSYGTGNKANTAGEDYPNLYQEE